MIESDIRCEIAQSLRWHLRPRTRPWQRTVAEAEAGADFGSGETIYSSVSMSVIDTAIKVFAECRRAEP